MQVAVFGSRRFVRPYLDSANAGQHLLVHFDRRLTGTTAALATGCAAVSLFSNDVADARTIATLARLGVRLIALRSAGYDNVDLAAAHAHGIAVARVPAYSPHAVAEHGFALLLALNRKIHLAYDRVRRRDFSLDGLTGFDLAGKTIGIVGVGTIGSVAAKIAAGFGCTVLGTDPAPPPEVQASVNLVPLDDLLERSDVVSLHCCLTASTRHLIGQDSLRRMKPGALLINTSRGAVVDTQAVIDALESGTLGGFGADVYENEAALFFDDHSNEPPSDERFTRLIAFPNVLVTGHQGFLTHEALRNIAATTIENITTFETTGRARNEVPAR